MKCRMAKRSSSVARSQGRSKENKERQGSFANVGVIFEMNEWRVKFWEQQLMIFEEHHRGESIMVNGRKDEWQGYTSVVAKLVTDVAQLAEQIWNMLHESCDRGRLMARVPLVNAINKKYTDGIHFGNEQAEVTSISTGSPELDIAMGGGVPQGRSSRFYGGYGSTKTLYGVDGDQGSAKNGSRLRSL